MVTFRYDGVGVDSFASWVAPIPRPRNLYPGTTAVHEPSRPPPRSSIRRAAAPAAPSAPTATYVTRRSCDTGTTDGFAGYSPRRPGGRRPRGTRRRDYRLRRWF